MERVRVIKRNVRRGRARALIVGLLLCLLPWRDAGAEVVRVAYVSLGGSHAPLWVAREACLFSKHGLEVNPVLIGSDAGATPALIAGDIDILLAGAAAPLRAVGSGADLVFIAGQLPYLVFKLMVHSAIQKPEDLRDKRLGIQRFGDTAHYGLLRALERLGLDAKRDVKIIVSGNQTARLAAMKQGIIHGTVVNPPTKLVYEKEGFTELLDLAQLKNPFAGNVYTVRRAFAERNRETLEKFVAAVVEGIHRYKTDKELALKVIRKYLRTQDPAVVEVAYNGYEPVMPTLPYPSEEGFRTALEVLSQEVPKAREIDLKRVLDRSFVQKIETGGLMQKLYR